jgi:hypothetical protein
MIFKEMTKAYTILIGKSEGKILLATCRRRMSGQEPAALIVVSFWIQ